VPVVESGRPVRNANVEATVLLTQKDSQEIDAGRIALKDDGATGTYAGVFRPSTSGHYVVVATISGRQSQVGEFVVNPASASLISARLQTVEDELHAIMRFQIFSPGEYVITPTVLSSKGNIGYQLEDNLIAGEQEVVLRMPQKILQQIGAKPPYEFVEI